ncbi:MAG: single-stranded DNA-binding protein [Bacilli bacterium]
MNKVALIGRITKDLELKVTGSGLATLRFSLAINRIVKNKDGKYDADFINCVAFGKTAEIISKYCFKGSQIAIEGRIQTGSYDAQDGTKRYTTDVVVDRLELLGSKKDNETNLNVNVDSSFEYASNVDGPSQYTGIDVPNDNPFKDFGNEVTLSDDDLPF